MKLKVYTDRMSQPSRAIIIFCKVNGIQFDEISIILSKRQQLSPEFKEINPLGKVPAIVDGRLKLFESHAILIYLASAFPSVLDHWYPNDLSKRAKIHSVLDWHHTNLRPGAAGYVMNTVLAPHLGLTLDSEAAAKAENLLTKSLSTLETFWLKGNAKFLLGSNQPSIADLSLVCELMQLQVLDEKDRVRLFSLHKKVGEWIENTRKATMPHFDESPLKRQVNNCETMDPNQTSMWSSIVKKDPPPKPPTNDGDSSAILAMVGDCKSTRGISVAVVDANAVIEGKQSLTDFADKFVTVPEVLSEIRDPHSRRRLAFIPFTIETMEPSPESLSKVIKFARATGDLQTLSDVDLKLIALTYTLEAQVHGTKNLRDVPAPIQTVRVKSLPEQELPGWGSNVANLEEWEALEKETEENANADSKILPLKDLDLNTIASEDCSEVGSVVSHSEHQEDDEKDGERRHKRYPPKKLEVNLEGKMVVEGIDASKGVYDDEDSGDWRPAVSRSTHSKYLRRKARWEQSVALAEKEIQQDQEADKAVNTTNQISRDANEKNDDELSSILKDMRVEEDSLKALQEGEDETNDDSDVEAEEIEGADQVLENAEIVSEAGDTVEASSVADDGSSEQSWSLRALSESSVACITGDYAMQNVILQMGLRLLAPGGMQIRQLHRWILKCHACYTVTPQIGRIFCPKCGNGGTLRKVGVTIGANGTIIAARKPRIILRGTKYSIPNPKGGRDSITKNLVLREDQLPQKYLHPKTKKKSSKPGDEYFVSDDVFMNHHSDKRAPLQPPVRKAMQVFSQKRNPNDNHYSRSMH